MKPTYPLPVYHSWPLDERARYFALGQVHGASGLDRIAEAWGLARPLTGHALGRWECDLADGNRLCWSDAVYDIFGIARGAAVERDEVAALYCEESRAAMERLRAHAIRHRRGFTIDVEIQPVVGKRRWMRLIAAPMCDGEQVVRLEGLKFRLADARNREC